ncbi:formate transporter FocA [Glaesserella parasuis]|uniref:formate transporter FocA n=1 Tax=Glaesserella parasuis TaxID=738 RepID=UPI000DD44BAE|nr:formate transporter FocA [Glaesserella parasuis]MDG6453965.1 formate transporter FocA [Glaesserella parasuis]MDO9923426.1 formate transporter FocA [Glaesserella parasuis]MDO9938442.1 formate transporter FocA [Glaesserella parasuis]MDO9940583.1 formate transporter FocA [Glaesserella parasuis]MDO9951170.1 formate transporter FocA [Glaesserella parasuis]
MFSPAEMAKIAEDGAVYKATKNQFYSFISAITAGAYISIAFVFYATIQVGAGELPWGVAKLIGGVVFSLGIIMCVVFGAELFTSTTMTIVAKASKRISLAQMFKNWFVVYGGNFIGATFIVLLVWFSGEIMAANGQWGLTILKTVQHKLHHTWIEAFSLGIFCNLMVCIAVWMAYAGKSLTDKAFIMILPIAMFVASGFEHCVANMFMIPMGVLIHGSASPEFWTAIGVDPSQFADLTMANFVVKNLIPATLGNIVGGAFFIGMVQWFLHLKKH